MSTSPPRNEPGQTLQPNFRGTTGIRSALVGLVAELHVLTPKIKTMIIYSPQQVTLAGKNANVVGHQPVHSERDAIVASRDLAGKL